MKMKSVVITGATSYIAVALIKRLLSENYMVYAIVRPNSRNLEKLPKHDNIQIVELEMDEIERFSERKLTDVEAVYHFAWDGVRGEKRNDISLQQKNYLCAVKCINMMVNMDVHRFIGIGSQAEYGMTQGITTETTMLSPVSEYGKKKVAVYQYGMEKCKDRHNFRFLWARIFSTFGNGEDTNTLVMQCIEKMRNNFPIDLSPCEHFWDYTYVEDVAEALFLLMTEEVKSGAYNISYGQARPLKEYIESMKRVLQSDSQLNFGALSYGKSQQIQMNPDVSKLKMATGWKPIVSFEEGITKIIKG